MKVNYYPETDSLYIELNEQPSAQSVEISEGVVLDDGTAAKLIGIDIDTASTKVELNRLILSKLPGAVETDAA